MPSPQPQQTPLTAAEVESPIINSPFREPQCHWQIEPGVRPVKAEGRRRGGYFFRGPKNASPGGKSKAQPTMFGSGKSEKIDLPPVNCIPGPGKTSRAGHG